MNDLTASWQPDPTGRHDHRYWDGAQWTQHVADAGTAGIDPYDAAPPESPALEEPEPKPEPQPGPEPEPMAASSPEPVSTGDGGSKRVLIIGGGILAAVVVAVIAFVALGGDDSGTKTTNTTSGTTETTKPKAKAGTYGSDPELDAEYDACANGDFASCDLLYLDGPIGSEYRDFGDTCGNRNEPGELCITLYPNGAPDTTAPTDSTGGN